MVCIIINWNPQHFESPFRAPFNSDADWKPKHFSPPHLNAVGKMSAKVYFGAWRISERIEMGRREMFRFPDLMGCKIEEPKCCNFQLMIVPAVLSPEIMCKRACACVAFVKKARGPCMCVASKIRNLVRGENIIQEPKFLLALSSARGNFGSWMLFSKTRLPRTSF